MEGSVPSEFIGLIGVVIGGVIGSIPIYVQEKRRHKRWMIEKRIGIYNDQIADIEHAKKQTIADLKSLFSGKSFSENDEFILSVPMEVIKILSSAFKEQVTDLQSKKLVKNLSESKKREILIDIASAFEAKRFELQNEVKKLVK